MQQSIVQVGEYSDAPSYMGALHDAGVAINAACRSISQRHAVPVVKRQLSLVYIRVAELGYPDGATLASIYFAAYEAGYVLCPLEAGLVLGLHHLNQAPHESIFIGMVPVWDEHGKETIFLFQWSAIGILWLEGCPVRNERVWRPNDVFVFAMP